MITVFHYNGKHVYQLPYQEASDKNDITLMNALYFKPLS